MGIQGNDLGHGKNVTDWAIRRTASKPDMAGHEAFSEIAKVSVINDELATLRLLKVRSIYHKKLWYRVGIQNHRRHGRSGINTFASAQKLHARKIEALFLGKSFGLLKTKSAASLHYSSEGDASCCSGNP